MRSNVVRARTEYPQSLLKGGDYVLPRFIILEKCRREMIPKYQRAFPETGPPFLCRRGGKRTEANCKANGAGMEDENIWAWLLKGKKKVSPGWTTLDDYP